MMQHNNKGTTMNVINQIVARTFGRKTISALAKKGIRIIDTKAMPGLDGSYIANDAFTGYYLDDNGCQRIRTFSEVLALAK